MLIAPSHQFNTHFAVSIHYELVPLYIFGLTFTYVLIKGYYYFYAKKWRLMKTESHVKSVCKKQPQIQLVVTVARPGATVNV